MVLELKAHRGE